MRIQKDVIYRVYRLNTDTTPYSLFIWDMIDFEVRKVLRNIERIFPDPPILHSAITSRFEDQDELILEFETLHEINIFPEELNIYKLTLDLGEVKITIDNEDRFTLLFDNLDDLNSIQEFVTDQLGIPDIDQYLFCLDKPNIYFCYDYYGRFVEFRQQIGDLGD